MLFANSVMLIPVMMGDRAVALFTAALTLLIVPAYLAGYFYAYRSAGLWDSDH